VVRDPSMMMEKSWVMMMSQTDKEHEEWEEVSDFFNESATSSPWVVLLRAHPGWPWNNGCEMS